MNSEIIQVDQKTIVGMKLEMSLLENQTPGLWQKFMPKLNSISNRLDNHLISMTIYPSDYFQNFNPSNRFKKWAGIEVSKAATLFDELEIIKIPSGLYVRFLYQGLPSQAGPFYQSIFQEWLPKSGYKLDNRPHFELMGDKYKNNDPSSEEMIYIPVMK
ncbi:GyrI-like domain-containing protein [Leptospira sp. 2 VSF19]|uniref:GyrI-like domain-containing protein n=1 Tax=Leptospira soteropolitanensis TaxID=2950025 RepID=A0AAW5VI03_9LEPT|nr:GyrI-like domain-containing protein [Leptospira soteropolitanensis]MCW7491671.1 GyrI-like domain-containing protein [Leptospira soteropolitanensis]MCW7499255.1 GyrI-like domain-containing protein [Leptospira soteropolitanensis]MCW7521153.1 GyrI-like domain-containing protein [Leptospira soteropolitanensis]MCW7525359.1 GyrI-like domain-containing protein [Leptospira soteropolitanensis]MCW7529226.1 GyrI-like domain-containing protein [Leptospira soteropolitanensis]